MTRTIWLRSNTLGVFVSSDVVWGVLLASFDGVAVRELNTIVPGMLSLSVKTTKRFLRR